jgi:hypothetical protein
VGGEAPVTPVLSLDSSYLSKLQSLLFVVVAILKYKPCDNIHNILVSYLEVIQNFQVLFFSKTSYSTCLTSLYSCLLFASLKETESYEIHNFIKESFT